MGPAGTVTTTMSSNLLHVYNGGSTNPHTTPGFGSESDVTIGLVDGSYCNCNDFLLIFDNWELNRAYHMHEEIHIIIDKSMHSLCTVQTVTQNQLMIPKTTVHSPNHTHLSSVHLIKLTCGFSPHSHSRCCCTCRH